MAIIKQLDQNYTTPVLLGLKKANIQANKGIKKNELVIRADKGPTASMSNQINYN